MSEWMDVDIALASVPVNMLPLIDDGDFKSIEAAVVFNQAGLALFWNFTTTAGVTTVTAVTPTSAGDYDWTDFTTSGMYGIEIPASGGASANNDTEGFGYFTGVATGVLPWRGPTIGFRAAAVNNDLIDAGSALAKASALADVPTVAEFEARTIVAADYFDPAADAVANVTLVATTTTNTDMRGTDNAATAAALATVDGKLPAALVSGRMNSNVSAVNDESGAAIRMSRFFLAGRHGVAQGGTPGTITLAPGAVTDDDFFNGSTVVLSANTGRRQFRLITDCTAADDQAVITPDWIITPDDSTEYVIIPFGLSDAVAISGSVAVADSITEARMATLTDWIDGGRLDTLLDAIPTTVMRGTDNAATAANLATVDTVVDGIQTDLSNGTDGLGALKTLIDTVNTDLANGTDGLGAIKTLIDTLDTVADAIRARTDKLTFTSGNNVDSNVQKVNDVAVIGTGASGDEWGP